MMAPGVVSRFFPAFLLVLFSVTSAAASPSATLAAASPPATPAEAHIDSLWSAGERENAVAAAVAGITRAEASGDSCLLGRLLFRQGYFDLADQDIEAACTALARSVDICEACRDSVFLCRGLRWLGRAYGFIGRSRESRAHFARTIEVGTAIGDSVNTGWGHVGVGWADWLNRRVDEAQGHFEQAVSLFRGLDVDGETWARNNLAIILEYEGRYEEAIAVLHSNAELAGAHGKKVNQAIALNSIGAIQHILGRPDLAYACYRKAEVLLRESGARLADHTAVVNLARCLEELGRTAEAESVLVDLRRQGRETNDPRLLDTAGLELAELYGNLGRVNAARGLLAEVLADARTLVADDLVEVHHNLSRFYRKEGEFSAALAELEKAASLFARNVGRSRRHRILISKGEVLLELGRPREALVTAAAVAGVDSAAGALENSLNASLLMGRAYQALARPDSALACYFEAAQTWSAIRRSPDEKDWREHRSAWGRDLFPLLAGLLIDEGRLQEAVDRLQVYKARTLLERMVGPDRRATERAGAGVDAAVTVAELQGGLLKPDEVLLDYYLGREFSLVFGVTRDTLVAARLPGRDELGNLLKAYHDLLRNPDSGSPGTVAAVGRQVEAVLLANLKHLVGAGRRVLVSPDGVVNLIPVGIWQRSGDSRSTAGWVRIPSATVLATIRRTPADPAAGGTWRMAAVSGSTTGGGQALAGSRREVLHLVHSYREASLVPPPPAIPDTGAVFPSGAEILHIAAHARIDDQSPWNSSVLVDTESGPLPVRASRIAGLDLDARLVVLSSCNTAMGRVISGEGVTGLTSAFFSAGVPTVVASLWSVDDAVTADFMGVFYDAMARGRDATSALQVARDRIRAGEATSHPAYWAGFVVAGEGDLKPDLRRARRIPAWVVALAALLFLAMAGWLGARGRHRISA